MRNDKSMVAGALVLACSSAGCAGWLATSTEGTLDTRRRPSVGQRVELGIAFGDDSRRVYGATEVAVGQAMREQTTYVTVEDELGYEGGGPVRAAIGFRAGATFLTLDEAEPAVGAGPVGKLVFRVLHPSDANDLYLGPEVGASVVSEPTAGLQFRASAALALRWVLADSTEDRPPRFLR